MTKIDIISGFLGAGKTTLIRKMLEEVFTGEQVVLVENEYGEVGIDSGFLKDAGVEIRELNSGCICCTLVGDFNKSLREVIDTYHPDRILIEPSGVGKLSDVMSSVKSMEEEYPDVRLNALVTVANALKAAKQMKAFGEFFNNQIENATTVVLSRTQNAKPAQLELCVKMIQELNPKAAVITTPWDEIAGEQILQVIEGQGSLMEEMMAEFEAVHEHDHHHEHDHDHEHEHGHDHHDHDHDHEHCHDHDDHDHCHDHDHHGHHHADDVFTSWGRETPHKFTKESLDEILKSFCDSEEYGTILRAKGMVPAEDGTWIYFDMVPGEYELRGGEPDYTGRLCVIGTDLDEKKLEAAFGL
ncbi:MAG: GTP-binding protein [Clostridiales bacterium]|nr:GTP-binding protein [Clostridiales bacterium]